MSKYFFFGSTDQKTQFIENFWRRQEILLAVLTTTQLNCKLCSHPPSAYQMAICASLLFDTADQWQHSKIPNLKISWLKKSIAIINNNNNNVNKINDYGDNNNKNKYNKITISNNDMITKLIN